jgi:VanZ like family
MNDLYDSDPAQWAGEQAQAICMEDLPVFQQRWWVEIARGTAHLNEAQVVEGNIVVGRLPYVVQRNKAGFKCGGLFNWTHMGGPVISQDLSEEAKAEVLRQLLAQLPRNISLHFVFGPASADAELIREAFRAAGFERSRVITYSLPPNAESIINRLSRKHAKHIISADRRLDVIDISADRFIKFYAANLKDAGKVSKSPLGIAHDLIAAGGERNPPQVRAIAARKRPEREENGSLDANLEEDILDAAIACAWDNERYYLWMLTRRRDASLGGKPHPDAVKLLVVKAVEHARSLGLIFDSDGVGSAGSGLFYDKILKIPNMEIRDAYERPTFLNGLAKEYPSLGIAAWLIFSRIGSSLNWVGGNVVMRATAGCAIVLLLFATVILCGSLFPFEYHERSYPGGPLAYLLSTWREWDHSRDLLANILLYLPFGFMTACALPRRLSRAARALIATLAGTALAGGMEAAQFYDVGRVTSMGDVYANGIGAGMGAVAAALWRPLVGEFAADRSAVRSGRP